MSSSGAAPVRTDAQLPDDEHREQRRTDHEQPPLPQPAGRRLHQRQQQRQHACAEQGDADEVDVLPRRARPRSGAAGRPAPAPRRRWACSRRRSSATRRAPRHREDHPTDHGPTAVEIPTVAPNRPNARPRSAPWNRLWISAEFCGASEPAPGPAQPRRDQARSSAPPRPRRCTARRRRARAGTSAAGPARPRAGRPGRSEPERQRVARDDPLGGRRVGAQAVLDRRQRDRHDAHVEQRHEAGDERDVEGAPPPRVRRPGRSRLSTRRAASGRIPGLKLCPDLRHPPAGAGPATSPHRCGRRSTPPTWSCTPATGSRSTCSTRSRPGRAGWSASTATTTARAAGPAAGGRARRARRPPARRRARDRRRGGAGAPCAAALPRRRRAGVRAQPHPVGHHGDPGRRRHAAAAQPGLPHRPPPPADATPT